VRSLLESFDTDEKGNPILLSGLKTDKKGSPIMPKDVVSFQAIGKDILDYHFSVLVSNSYHDRGYATAIANLQ